MRSPGPRWRRAALLGLFAFLLAVPAGAAAGSTYFVPSRSLTFGEIAGSHGYTIHFSQYGLDRANHFKLKATDRSATMTYEIPSARAPGNGAAADLGRRGRFDLRFVPAGKVRPLGLGRGCEGPKGRWQRGYLVGFARFRGEGDYTEAHAHRIAAIAESWPRFRCHYEERFARSRDRRVQVWAHHRGIEFGAAIAPQRSVRQDGQATFWAWSESRAGRLRISREVEATAPGSSFAFPGGPKLPEEVTVTPPQPFSGSASFARTPESAFTWTGDLAVEFPDSGSVRLAGPSFGAGVCGLTACVREEPDSDLRG